MGRATKNKYPVKSLSKALRILDVLGEKPNGCGLTEISSIVKIGKSTVHRLLSTLKDEGYVLTNPVTSRYMLGGRVAILADRLSRQSPLLMHSHEILRRLVAKCNETANVAVLEGTEIVYIAGQECNQPLRNHFVLGLRVPAHCTALGKTCLSGLADDEIRFLYRNPRKLTRFTPHTVAGLDELIAELAVVRAEGFAFDREEHEQGVHCLAAPVRDSGGRVVASISLAMPKHRWVSERGFQTALGKSASELSYHLGYGSSNSQVRWKA